MSDDPERQILGRRGALLVMFGMEFTGYEAEEALELSRSAVEAVAPEILAAWELVAWRVEGFEAKRDAIDAHLQKVSPRWKLERMDHVDRDLLRIGAWEVLESEIPPIVTINACVELAKDYGEESSPGFVNGLLDELCSDQGIEVA